MGKPKGIRRFLRFSLRSLMLVTLAVAAWLGYEVHQARTVERQAEAIRALGGEVEFEPWASGLLRFMDPQSFGRRIVSVQIDGACMDEILPALKSLPGLRELKLDFDGTTDLRLNELGEDLPNARIQASAGSKNIYDGQIPNAGDWNTSKARQRYERFAAKLRACSTAAPSVARALESRIAGEDRGWYWDDGYELRPLQDGSTAELLVTRLQTGFVKSWDIPGAIGLSTDESAILLVDDRCVGAISFTGPKCLFGGVAIEHSAGNPLSLSVDMYAPDGWTAELRTTLKNDPLDFTYEFNDTHPVRSIVARYAIEPTGFRCLSPDDPFKD